MANKSPNLTIPHRLWAQLTAELCKRSNAHRESGAFLLSEIGTTVVHDFVCFDDLDPLALETGIIRFHAEGFVRLWNSCQERRLRVAADVHTHPDDWTGQSCSDRTNPMINQKGHFALILPRFAQGIDRTLTGVGIYEYLGNHRWKPWKPDDGRIELPNR